MRGAITTKQENPSRTTSYNLPYKKPGAKTKSTKHESGWVRLRKALLNSATFTLLIVVLVAITFFLGGFNAISWKGVLATIITMGMLLIYTSFWAVKKYDEGYAKERMDALFFLIPTILMLFMAFFATTVIYDVGFFAMFSSDWIQQLYWFVIFEMTFAIIILAFNLVRDWHARQVQKFWNDVVLLLVAIVPIVLVSINPWLSTLSSAGVFIVIVIVMALLLVAWVWKLPKELKVKAGLVYGGMAFAFTLLILMFWNPFVPSGKLQGFVPVVGGDEAPVNYFSYIWYIFFESPAAAIMIAIMTFGTTVNLFTATLGGADMLRGLGVLIMVFPPMLIILEMWTGGIAPPTVLSDILGIGVAAPIFAICETGVFAIMAGLLGYFGGYAKLLTQRFGIPQF